MMKCSRLALALALTGFSAGAALAEAPQRPKSPSPAWPGTSLGRVEAAAVMQTLNARLLGSSSATFTLEEWCAEHKLAQDPRLVATLDRDVQKPASAETRERLQVGPDEPVKYRRVRLSCGGRVLSEADNWYVPGRLTPDMNRLLETTTTPFGRVVRDLAPSRRTFAVKQHWSPLSQGWEMETTLPADDVGPLAIPEKLFEHRALLYTGERQPFSEVDETYTAEVLGFTPPAK